MLSTSGMNCLFVCIVKTVLHSISLTTIWLTDLSTHTNMIVEHFPFTNKKLQLLANLDYTLFLCLLIFQFFMIQENLWLQGFQIWKRNVLKMRYVWGSFNQIIKKANKFYYWENTNVRFWFYFSVIAETLMKLP